VRENLTSQTRHNGVHERLANGLGWFSIGLGVAEVVAPGKVAGLIGAPNRNRTRKVLRTYGFREIAAGVGILSNRRPAGWVWGRVGGDLMDLASLGSAMNSRGANRTRLMTATAAVLGVTALDVVCGQQLTAQTNGHAKSADHSVRIAKSAIIDRSAEDLYRFWRNLENLPAFMTHLESVQVTGNRSHWKAKGPLGKTVEWDAETTGDEPDSRIAWRTLGGSIVEHSGSVRFERAPGGRGTLVTVEMNYMPPGGAIAAKAARLAGMDPGDRIERELHAFKQLMETGEIVKSDASIYPGMHAAQPSAEPVPA
jgi:uncharacterized membrane protein